MLQNYLKIAWRNLLRYKGYSVINIGGLAIGMAVAMLIGLWIWDELAYNQSIQHYDRIALVKQHLTYNGKMGTQEHLPYPTGRELRAKYGSYFTLVVTTTGAEPHLLSAGDKKFSKLGSFMEAEAPELLSLTMKQGARAGLNETNSILLAQSLAQAYFGTANPVGKLIRMDNETDVTITGVYEDFPRNSEFSDVLFIATWKLYLRNKPQLEAMPDPWAWNGWYTYVQVADQVDVDKASVSIRNLVMNAAGPGPRKLKPQLFLDPMRNWHLYADFENGVRTGGLIEYVWLFGIIGLFVLGLACINFMNLSTARSEKRAKEVGIRKAVGSLRGQLIGQFFSESLLIVTIAFGLALLLVLLLLPTFNGVADKQLSVPWQSPVFWLAGVGFAGLTGLLAGSYPAFFLSSFQPVDVLKGAGAALRFRLGRLAVAPRRVLVVVQFTVSVTLIIGTLVVFRQIQFARNRPVGYNRNGLVMLPINNDQIHRHFDAVRTELKRIGAIENLAESVGPVTDTWATSGEIDWPGKAPGLAVDFPNKEVSPDFGRTVGWQFTQGRDFSPAFPSDSAGFVINEAAVKFMNLKNPVGQFIRWEGKPFRIIGVIKDVVVDSPYEPVRAALYRLANHWTNFVVARLNPAKSTAAALSDIETVFKKYNPAEPFDFTFVDQAYARKFGDEERIGKLASFFAGLAVFISCLGLFGLASFVAEQRTKEIGIRKVLGASTFMLWRLLSLDFIMLVGIGFGLAVPIAYHVLSGWLQHYDYRTDMPWWLFAVSGLSTLLITLLTVSFQSVKAALINPVESLRSE